MYCLKMKQQIESSHRAVSLNVRYLNITKCKYIDFYLLNRNLKLHIIYLIVIYITKLNGTCIVYNLFLSIRKAMDTIKKFMNLWKTSIFETKPWSLWSCVSALAMAFWAVWTRSSVNLSPNNQNSHLKCVYELCIHVV